MLRTLRGKEGTKHVPFPCTPIQTHQDPLTKILFYTFEPTFLNYYPGLKFAACDLTAQHLHEQSLVIALDGQPSDSPYDQPRDPVSDQVPITPAAPIVIPQLTPHLAPPLADRLMSPDEREQFLQKRRELIASQRDALRREMAAQASPPVEDSEFQEPQMPQMADPETLQTSRDHYPPRTASSTTVSISDLTRMAEEIQAANQEAGLPTPATNPLRHVPKAPRTPSVKFIEPTEEDLERVRQRKETMFRDYAEHTAAEKAAAETGTPESPPKSPKPPIVKEAPTTYVTPPPLFLVKKQDEPAEEIDTSWCKHHSNATAKA
jgi:hypothetical protein